MDSRDIALGVDIGGTTTSFGFVDREGRVLAEATIPTEGSRPAQTLVPRLAARAGELLQGLPDTRLIGVGVCAPNANQNTGTVENAVNLAWDPVTDLRGLVREAFGLPTEISNDANAAALGEMLFGGAKGMQHFIVITLGTGLGSGLVANGQLLLGADGLAGELGHLVVQPEGRQCGCGKRGCLETYVSATGLCRTLFEMLADSREPSSLRAVAYQDLNAKMVFEAASAGDPVAQAAFDRTARILGLKLADAVAHTGPEAIFLFGGLVAAGDLLLGPAKAYMEEYLFPAYRGHVSLLPSQMQSGSAAVLGAAALIWSGQVRYPAP
jgi:glucokinase